MRKVIGIGETILDIIFRNGQPTAAVPGGSVFNGVVSLARAGVPVSFISETGNDRVGNTILQSMRDSGMSTEKTSGRKGKDQTAGSPGELASTVWPIQRESPPLFPAYQ